MLWGLSPTGKSVRLNGTTVSEENGLLICRRIVIESEFWLAMTISVRPSLAGGPVASGSGSWVTRECGGAVLRRPPGGVRRRIEGVWGPLWLVIALRLAALVMSSLATRDGQG